MRLPPDSNDDLLAELRSSVVPVEHPDAAAAQRLRVVERMKALQLRAVRRRASVRPRRVALAAAASVLALAAAGFAVMGLARPTGPDTDRHATLRAGAEGAELVRGKVTRAGDLPADEALLPTDHVRTASDGDATIVMPSGAVVVAGGDTSVWVVATTPTLEKVSLERGHVDVRVPKRPRGEAFVVETPDSTITVHGTRFGVTFSPSCHRPSCTSVNVTEGRVGVLHDGVTTELRAGESWPSSALPTLPPSDPQSGASAVVAPVAPAVSSRRASESSAVRGKARAGIAEGPTSSLSQENALMQRAMVAERGGSPALTVQLLDEFLSKYASSPLARNAELERLRALHRAGNTNGARAAARRYLARYTEGMGTDEARRIALDGNESRSAPSR